MYSAFLSNTAEACWHQYHRKCCPSFGSALIATIVATIGLGNHGTVLQQLAGFLRFLVSVIVLLLLINIEIESEEIGIRSIYNKLFLSPFPATII